MEPDPVLSSCPTLSVKRLSQLSRSLQNRRVISLSRSRRTRSSERMWLLLSLLPDTGDTATIHHPATASAVAAVWFPNTSGPSHQGTTYYCSHKPHQIVELSVSEKKLEACHQEQLTRLEKRENIRFTYDVFISVHYVHIYMHSFL